MKLFLSLVILASASADSSSPVDDVLNSKGLFSAFTTLSEDGVLGVLEDNDAVSKAYSAYTNQFGKAFDATRVSAFKENLRSIAAHNIKAREEGGFEKGVNQFSDMTESEIVQKFTGYSPSNGSSFSAFATPRKPPLAQKWSRPPASLDWRKHRVVSPVKNQKNCGSCVFFSTTGALEASHALWHDGKILDLSEQELVDCAKGDGNDGCSGGTFVPTFNYLQEKGLVTESDYSYTASDGDCRADDLDHVAKLTGWWPVKPAGNENALKTAVASYGPVSVAICVDNDVAGYRSGILDVPCCMGRNHAVLVVGYGTEGGKDFWIVKNSWGTGWGEKGYIRMKRNGGNMCDIAGDGVFMNA